MKPSRVIRHLVETEKISDVSETNFASVIKDIYYMSAYVRIDLTGPRLDWSRSSQMKRGSKSQPVNRSTISEIIDLKLLSVDTTVSELTFMCVNTSEYLCHSSCVCEVEVLCTSETPFYYIPIRLIAR